jgi:FecR protein
MRPLLLITMGAFAALAQDAPQGPITPSPSQEPQGDVPGRAARLALINGSVSFQPGSVEDWVPATPNRPLTTGDRLWTDTNSRAEISLGSADMRLSGQTNFSFINLDDRTAQMQLSMGSMSVRVRRLNEDEVIEVDTPQVALSLLRPGEYRIDVNEQGDTSIVTVRAGQAEATAGQAYTIQPRQQVRIMNSGENGSPSFDQRDMPPGDAFDNWCQSRDRQEDMSQSAKYVSRDTPGYADLDAAGTWRNDANYGNIWVPAGMGPDWAPYHSGHWAWVAPWGWTWVDDAPWGYAPYHYGRWVNVGGAWAWVPGPVVVATRPVYAPALVGWIGGPGFAVGIGWFPLGPREVFVPSYRYSPAYIERVNVTNTVIVNRAVFADERVANVAYMNRGAVTVVPGGAFVAGRPVAAAAIRVSPEVIARGQVIGAAGVAPQREAVLGGRAVTTVVPPAAVVNRTVVSRAAPPPAPVPFARQQQALQANGGRPLDRTQAAQIRASSPPQQRVNFRPATAAAAPARPTPSAPAVAARPATPAPGNQPVLHRAATSETPSASSTSTSHSTSHSTPTHAETKQERDKKAADKKRADKEKEKEKP